jgi:hypothetical protein
VNPGWRFKEGAALRPRLPLSTPCEMCGANVMTVSDRRICLSCGFMPAGCPHF